MLFFVLFSCLLSVLLDCCMVLLCRSLLVSCAAQANPVLSVSGSGSGLCVAARPVLCCAVFRSMGSELSTGRILVQDRRSVSRSVSQPAKSTSQTVQSWGHTSGGNRENGLRWKHAEQSRAGQGFGQELIAAEREEL